MDTEQPAIQVTSLVRKFGETEAVHGLNLTVQRGQCYGFFGRNGAGKTTTIKCLLNLLRPDSGQIKIFGLSPQASEVAVKSRIAYVPDYVAFYPWMTVRGVLDYLASFRTRWDRETELNLLGKFGLEENQKANSLSKGQKTQLALIGAVCAQPELLILDEPTSGLDPIVRREFIETIIGAYQEPDPANRTVFVSTHLISEFEGVIEKFTILEKGRDAMTLDSDEARSRYKKIRVSFPGPAPQFEAPQARLIRRQGRELQLLVNGHGDELLEKLRALEPQSINTEALTLEEIFVAALK